MLDMKNLKFLLITILFLPSLQFILAEEVVLIRRDVNPSIDGANPKRTRFYIPLSVSFESGELALFFESSLGMCNVSIEDENGNVQMSETIDTDNGTEFWFDLSGLSSGLHYVKISYGSINLVGEFYVE